MNNFSNSVCLCHKSADVKPTPITHDVIPETLYYEPIGDYIYPYTHAKLVYINEKLDDKEYATGKTVQEVLDAFLSRIEKLEQDESGREKFRVKIVDNLITNSGVQALSARQGMILKTEKEYTDCYKSDRWTERYIAYMETHKASKTPYYYFEDYKEKYLERSNWRAFFDFIKLHFIEGIEWIEIPWSAHEIIRIFDYNQDGYIFKFNRNGKLYRVYENNPEKPWDDNIDGTILVIDDCETEDPENALSARQGFLLQNAVDDRYTKEETDNIITSTVEGVQTEIDRLSNVIGNFRGPFPIESNTITSVLVDHEFNFDNLLKRIDDLEAAITTIKEVLNDIANPDI